MGDGAVGGPTVQLGALGHEKVQQAWMFRLVSTCWMEMSTEGRVSHINCPFPRSTGRETPIVFQHKMAKTIFKTVMVLLVTMPYTKVSEQNTTSISTLPNVKLRESRYLRNVGPLSTRGNIRRDKNHSQISERLLMESIARLLVRVPSDKMHFHHGPAIVMRPNVY